MYVTSSSARVPAARSFAAVWTELPSTYFTVAPVAFSNAVAWHFFELSTKVPPNVATTSSSPDAGSASPAMKRQISSMMLDTIMVGDSSRGAWWRDYIRCLAAPLLPGDTLVDLELFRVIHAALRLTAAAGLQILDSDLLRPILLGGLLRHGGSSPTIVATSRLRPSAWRPRRPSCRARCSGRRCCADPGAATAQRAAACRRRGPATPAS